MTVAASKLVRIGLLTPICEIDPRDSADNISDLVLGQVFDAPYAIAAGELQTRPLLFEPLHPEGRLQYSAAVRPAKFSDGTPLTAELAARSLRGAKILRDKTTIDVRGDRVWFTLTAPNPRFDLTLSQSNTSIVLDRGAQLLGTGPFLFEQRPNLRLLQSAKSFRLVRNPHYAGTNGVDEVEFRVFPAAEDGSPRALV
ncbi:MAG TPA: ABC transporter substrate-binding protein, partial [Thermoanaerobaculia bacterium]